MWKNMKKPTTSDATLDPGFVLHKDKQLCLHSSFAYKIIIEIISLLILGDKLTEEEVMMLINAADQVCIIHHTRWKHQICRSWRRW